MTFDRVFEDKASGKDTHRPQLQAALAHLRAGDTLVVHSMDRLARSLSDLLGMVKDLTGRGVAVEFCKEHLTFTGDDKSYDKLLLKILGAVAEFERDMILERQREGIALAVAEGRYKGRKKALTPEQSKEIRRRKATGESMTDLAEEFGVSRQTAYSALGVL